MFGYKPSAQANIDRHFGKPTHGVEYMSYKERVARLPYVADEYQEVAISNPNSTIEGEPARREGSPAGGGGNYNFDVTTIHPYIAFDYFAEDNNLAKIRVDFRVDTDNIFRIEKTDVSDIQIGVNHLIFNKTDVTHTIGNPSWDNITRVSIYLVANENGIHVWRIGKLRNYKFTSKVTIWFDDGHRTVRTSAKPTMDTYGFKGVQAIVGKNIDTSSSYQTSTHLAEMVAAGWEHCNHTYYHKNLSTLTAEEAEISIAKGLDYGLTHGFGKASYYFVNPQGDTSKISEPIEKKYSLLRRNRGGYNYFPIVDMYALACKEVTLTKPIEDIQSEIDTTIDGGLWLILLFHSIRPDDFETTRSTVCKQGKFDAIMDYLNTKQTAGELQVVTCSEALQSL